MVYVQVAVALVHAPVQLTKMNPGSALAVNVTTVPTAKLAEQMLPQLMPPVPVISPLPPEVFTDSVLDPLPPPPAAVTNVAVTLFAALIVTLHVTAEPAHAPLQSANVEPLFAFAVRLTMVFGLYTP